MKISMKSNRMFLVKALLPIVIIAAVAGVLAGIALAVNFEEQQDAVSAIVALGAVEIVLVAAILFIRFFRWNSYDFDEREIVRYKRNKKVDTIAVSEIADIYFRTFKFRYLITAILGELMDGGCWQLHVIMQDGTIKRLGCFSVKDAKLLQEKLYGDLIKII